MRVGQRKEKALDDRAIQDDNISRNHWNGWPRRIHFLSDNKTHFVRHARPSRLYIELSRTEPSDKAQISTSPVRWLLRPMTMMLADDVTEERSQMRNLTRGELLIWNQILIKTTEITHPPTRERERLQIRGNEPIFNNVCISLPGLTDTHIAMPIFFNPTVLLHHHHRTRVCKIIHLFSSRGIRRGAHSVSVFLSEDG